MATGPDFPFDNTKMCEIMDVFDGPEQEVVTTEKIMSTEFPRFNRICGATFKEHCQFPKCDCDGTDPPLTREELEAARDYARRLNTELRTYDAHLKCKTPGECDSVGVSAPCDFCEEEDHPDTCRCEVCRFWS